MKEFEPKVPTVEGLKRAQETLKKRRERKLSDRVMRVIVEVLREKFPAAGERAGKQRPQS